jgi:hypothetical protein
LRCWRRTALSCCFSWRAFSFRRLLSDIGMRPFGWAPRRAVASEAEPVHCMNADRPIHYEAKLAVALRIVCEIAVQRALTIEGCCITVTRPSGLPAAFEAPNGRRLGVGRTQAHHQMSAPGVHLSREWRRAGAKPDG